ncbi:MAG: pyridoxal-phosphate dependent enzyme, partial [Candidatus Nanoarchaeia archaeon]
KMECENPYGSHYDRVYLALFKFYEEQGLIRQGGKVIETTSGSAGVSFAGIGRCLGYECYVALPAGGERARERAVRALLPNPDNLMFTPADQYVNGFPTFLKEYLAKHPDFLFLNHSMGKRENGVVGNNEITLSALEKIAREVSGEKVDYFVSAVGNGSTLLGLGRVFNDVTIIGFESFQSAVAFNLKYPGEYKRKFDIQPGSLPRHRLPGTSYQGIDFPHIRNAIADQLVDDVILVSDRETDDFYSSMTGRRDTQQLPHWDRRIDGFVDVGRSTQAGIQVALQISKRVEGKNLLVIAYDKAERYDP